MSRFEPCYRAMMRWEKGYADHPRDPGGKTMDGVTQRVFHAWLRNQGKPVRPVRDITEAEKLAIYREQYWDEIKGDQLPPGIDLVVFDMAVNSGPSRSARYLQAALGSNRQDGVIGQVTLAAAREAYERDDDDDVIRRMMASRNAFLRGLPTWDPFGAGWANRTRDIEQRAARMEAIEDEARAFAKAFPREDADRSRPPVVYRPDKATRPVEPVTPVTVPDNLGQISAGAGIVSTLIAAVTSPWALGAVVVLAVAGGVAFWLHKSGRLTLNKREAA